MRFPTKFGASFRPLVKVSCYLSSTVFHDLLVFPRIIRLKMADSSFGYNRVGLHRTYILSIVFTPIPELSASDIHQIW